MGRVDADGVVAIGGKAAKDQVRRRQAADSDDGVLDIPVGGGLQRDGKNGKEGGGRDQVDVKARKRDLFTKQTVDVYRAGGDAGKSFQHPAYAVNHDGVGVAFEPNGDLARRHGSPGRHHARRAVVQRALLARE